MIFQMRLEAPESQMTARGLERFVLRPFGQYGGEPGALGRVLVNPGTEEERDVGKIDVLTVGAGDVVRFETPSGGGLGDPFERDTWRVLADVRAGMVTPEAARTQYGVVIAHGEVDEAATASLRAARPPKPALLRDLGPERAAYEERWPEAVALRLIGLLKPYPAKLRPLLMTKIRAALATAPKVTEALLDQVVAEVTARAGLSRLAAAPEAEAMTAFERLNMTNRKGAWL